MLKWHGKKISKEAEQGIYQTLDDITEFLLETANQTAPLREGTLRASGFADVDKETLTGVVAYDTPYAAEVHEGPERNWTTEGTRAKWLELTAQEQQNRIRDYMLDGIRRSLRG